MSAEPTVPAPATVPRRGFWFRRRSVPCPTWRFWLCAVLTVVCLILLAGRYLHGWLSVTEPVAGAKYFVVEGWASDYVMRDAAALAEDSGAERVFTTGVPLERGHYLQSFRTYADVAANTLAQLGLEPQLICPVPCSDAKTERTRAMAMALKVVLDKEPVPTTGRLINLITQGTHARRSRAIYQEVLGEEWTVGVISIPSMNYDADKWFTQSEGAKNVINEMSALGVKALGGN